ncbi:hypothetical protein F441_03697 [Phytophthora nicotianae CJ01A1]|uniref:DUF4939 domain-containing protein n=2 Tax=Phytophthora nicotianae TaxID=4792 RepID=W2HEZ2_PHYNI|nr:hypothetical protein L915_03614 [Phytophthora nicotianae]ETL46568.1 hypothetical protein L916_03559 [Phytophthora nicotianae]ETP23110.1 hypothetical protein F441_03697 [Phytophthora nicotianae CJ01A1]
MDPGEHFVPAQALVEGLTAAMGQLADHLMQQNHQFQSSLLEQLNAQRPVPEFKVEGTRMPTFPGLLEESVDEFIFGAKLFMQGNNVDYTSAANNNRVVAMLASNLRGGAASWYHTRVATEDRPLENIVAF